MKLVKWLSIAAFAASLAACGGGGGSAGSSGSTPTSGTTTATVSSATDLVVSLDKVTLNNTGTDRVVIRVIAVNAAGNAIAKAPVAVAVDNFAVFQGLTPLTDGAFKTDESGVFEGQITSPGNKSNRSINVTVTSGAATKNATIAVIGTQITLTPVPGAPTVGQAVSLNVKVADANGVGIDRASVSLSGSAGFSGAYTTDSNGNVLVTGNAPSSTGTFTVTVASLGVSSNFPLTVVSSASAIPAAVGLLGPGALDAFPTTVPVNLSPDANNRAVVTFKMINASDQPVKNVRVKFNIVPPGLGSGERMSTGDSVVYTDDNGFVTSEYIAGSRSSPNDGVTIRACFGSTDVQVASCAAQVLTRLTVTGRPLNISIFDNNTLQGKFNNTLYVQTLVLQVVDSANVPVRDAVVSTSVDVTHYGKGPEWRSPYAAPGVAPSRADTYTTTLSDSFVPTATTFNTAGQTVTVGINVWCLNEDLNRNGTRDLGEDLDGDGVLEPRSADVAVSTPNGNKTDANGNLLLDVAWGQNLGGWIAYTVKVTTNVQGSEGTNSRSFVTSVLESDVRNGSFLTPPYGIRNCRTNN